ncbi:hypothetical protein DAI22_08g142300 [Oryza sativa Japonica Group]|uniref:Uncharacterized protein n=3 Tax=Oryza TaxID=4527 RepID=Q6ZKD9_ORYSJ|nr:hypothetical protein DAI22_08g142300 [Oryza sativa Japonica Group]BAD05211.1 unknown protein [Oryza sativa Japonica Group]
MGSPSAKYLLFSLAILLVLSSQQQALLPSAFARQLVPMPTNTAAGHADVTEEKPSVPPSSVTKICRVLRICKRSSSAATSAKP